MLLVYLTMKQDIFILCKQKDMIHIILAKVEVLALSEEILKIANGSAVWIIAAFLVAIVAIQAVLYTKLANSTAKKIGMEEEKCKKAFKIGIVSAIGPSVAVFIIMVGLMSVIGGPISWMRLSIIGAAATELTAARVGAEAVGAQFGGSNYNLAALATSWWTLAINGCGWLLVCALFTTKFEGIRMKIAGNDVKLLAGLSTASLLGAFGYLNSGDVIKGGGRLIALLFGALVMILIVKLIEKSPKFAFIKDYSLGIAMLLGMTAAIISKITFGLN